MHAGGKGGFGGIAALALVAALLVPAAASAAERHATPATLDRVFASARAGDTIRLAAGDYGAFDGGLKAGPGKVVLAPERGARPRPRIKLWFDPASNITVRGLTITGALLYGSSTRNITIAGSNIPGQVALRTDSLPARARIVLAGNVIHDWDTCSSCGEGRIFMPGGDHPSGITIRDNEIYGGLSDGIQNGSTGTRILRNEFHHIGIGSPEGVHSDALQLVGSSRTVIRGNYFHDLPNVPAIMAPDGADHELIEDNVMAGDANGYPFITLFSDDGSIIRHNTFADGDCVFNIRCGVLRIGAKAGDPLGRGTVVTDNILGSISIEAGSLARRSHNLIAFGSAPGPAEIRGRPTYVGGWRPSTFAGFALASGSLGKRNASDRLDRGARLDRGPRNR